MNKAVLASYRLRKRIITAMAVSVAICIVAALLICSVPKAHAAGDAASIAEGAIAAQLVIQMNNLSDSIMDSTKEKLDMIDAVRTDPIFTFFWSLFQVLGIAMLAIYYVIRIIRDLQKEEATAEFWVRIGMTFTLSLVLLTNLDWLFNSLDTLGLAIRDAAANAVDTINHDYRTAFESSGANVFFNTLQDILGSESSVSRVSGAWSETAPALTTPADYLNLASQVSVVDYTLGQAELLILSALSVTVRFGLNGVIYFVGFMFILRRTFAPIAIAHIMMEGAKSPGTRYLKRYAALYLQEAMLYIVACIGTHVASIIMQGANIRIYVMWSIMGAVVIVMGATGRFSRELIGAD